MFATIRELINRRKSKKDKKFSFSSLLSSLIIFPLLFISIASIINQYDYKKDVDYRESIVRKKESKINEKDKVDSKYWIHTNIGFYNEKFEIKSELWNDLQENDTIILTVRSGNLGYDVIDRVEKKPTANNSNRCASRKTEKHNFK